MCLQPPSAPPGYILLVDFNSKYLFLQRNNTVVRMEASDLGFQLRRADLLELPFEPRQSWQMIIVSLEAERVMSIDSQG